MTPVAAVERVSYWTLGELLDAVTTLTEQDGITIPAAVEEILKHSEPDAEASDYLWRVGLRKLAQDRKDRVNAGYKAAETTDESVLGPGRDRFNIPPPEHRRDALRRLYVGADQTLKRWADFTGADCAFLEKWARRRAVGFYKLKEAARLTGDLLVENGALIVRELPDDAKDRVRQALERARTR